MKVTTRAWDTSEYLDSPEMIREYLNAAFESGDEDLIVMAIGNVAKAQGMSEIARKTKLSRQNLYKALSPGGSPKLKTAIKVLEALGCKLAIA
jgi:probable addiction module antidote protein